MRYEKKDAETMPARHTVYLDATDMEKAVIMYIRELAKSDPELMLAQSPTDTAVLSLGSPKNEQDHSLVWHTKD